MLEFDKEIVARIEHLVNRIIDFRRLSITQRGLDQMRTFNHEEIERRCAEKDYAVHPYIEIYENMVAKSLEKRCIRRTFPNAVPEKCEKPCKGYDKFCADYIPTETFNLTEIERMLDYQDLRKQYPNLIYLKK